MKECLVLITKMEKDSSNIQTNPNILVISPMINHMDMVCFNTTMNIILGIFKMDPWMEMDFGKIKKDKNM
jgi:hypothetical protein